MAIVLGSNDTTNFTDTTSIFNSSSGTAAWFPRNPSTATATGTTGAIYLYHNSFNTSTALKLGIWRESDGVLLGTTAALTSGDVSGGWLSGALSVSITASTQYRLGFLNDTGYYRPWTYTAGTDTSKDAANSYTTPEDATFTNDVNDQFLMYVTDTPVITSVSTDDVVGTAENPWSIVGTGFGTD